MALYPSQLSPEEKALKKLYIRLLEKVSICLLLLGSAILKVTASVTIVLAIIYGIMGSLDIYSIVSFAYNSNI